MHSINALLRILLMGSILCLSGGCASTYDARYFYEPRPASIETFDQATDHTIARTLVSVLGVRRHSANHLDTPVIEVRMLIENVSDTGLTIDLASARLVSADVRELDPPLFDISSIQSVPPDSTKSFDLAFPFPASAKHDPYDLSGLNFHWTFQRDGERLGHETDFTRIPIRYIPRVYDPWYPYYGSYGYHSYGGGYYGGYGGGGYFGGGGIHLRFGW